MLFTPDIEYQMMAGRRIVSANAKKRVHLFSV